MVTKDDNQQQDVFTSDSLKNNPMLQVTMGQFDKLFPRDKESITKREEKRNG